MQKRKITIANTPSNDLHAQKKEINKITARNMTVAIAMEEKTNIFGESSLISQARRADTSAKTLDLEAMD
jgi:hypothetical protein